MPTYTYECQECGLTAEHFCRIADRPESMMCPSCPGQMRQILVPTAIQIDTAQDVPWLDDFAKSRMEHRKCGAKPIETRGEYKQYLKDHDLRPCDGENLSEV